MAVNQTQVIMKNVILTHKELQLYMFMSFADGLIKGFQVPKGYFLSWSDDPKCFNLEFWKSAVVTDTESTNGYEILKYGFNKGYNEMNDVRLGVMIQHLRDKAPNFIEMIDDWFKEKQRAEFPIIARKAEPDLSPDPSTSQKAEYVKVCIPTEAYFSLVKSGFTPEVIV